METTRLEDPDSDSDFVALLTSHQQALRLYVSSLLPGCPEVSDIAQQANVIIWEKRADYELGTNFKAWIFAIARYKVLEYRKRKVRDSRLVFSDELEETFAKELPLLPDDLDLRQQHLRACMDELKPAHRDLIQHRYFHHTPLEEYARSIGRSHGGLRVTLQRLRAKLAACIDSKLAANS